MGELGLHQPKVVNVPVRVEVANAFVRRIAVKVIDDGNLSQPDRNGLPANLADGSMSVNRMGRVKVIIDQHDVSVTSGTG
jgi:hypothetical protein